MTTPGRPTGPALPAGRAVPAAANVVLTPRLSTYLASLNLTVMGNEIAALDGEPGLGKTTLGNELRRQTQAAQRFSPYVQLPRAVRDKDLYELLHQQICGSSPTTKSNARDLREDIIDQLTGSNAVVYLDDAHMMGVHGLQQVRYLHDRGNNTWALILMGAEIRAALATARELSSRIPTVLSFAPLTGGELLAALRAYDPMFRAADPALLDALDRARCHGNWRRWAAVRTRMHSLAAATNRTTLTRSLADDILASFGAPRLTLRQATS